MPSSATKRAAFTLVELLTVITIITILIAVLLPSLSQARRAAQDMTVRTQLNAIEVGLELFRNDPVNNGQHPPSALDQTQRAYTGAHFLADALVGSDLLGWDPLALSSSQQDRNRAWYAAANQPPNPRKGPYVELDNIATMIDSGDAFNVSKAVWQGLQGRVAGARVLIDKTYGNPDRPAVGTGVGNLNHVILYYRALPGATSVTPLGQIYNALDNDLMVTQVDNARDGKRSPLSNTEASGGLGGGGYAAIQNRQICDDHPIGSFWRTIWNQEASRATSTDGDPCNGTFHRPRRADSFILWAPGFDGQYGTADDIKNFDE